jgi:hypothetical protein
MHCPLYNIHRQQLVYSFNKLNIEFTIQTILYGSETSDYNQNVKLLRAVHSFIKRSKRFDNNHKIMGGAFTGIIAMWARWSVR